MNNWPAAKASRVLAALLRIGWKIKRQSGSHRTLERDRWPDFVFAFHDNEEIGPRMLARIAKRTGLSPADRPDTLSSALIRSMRLSNGRRSPADAHDSTSGRRVQRLLGRSF